MMGVSNKIKLENMRSALGMESESFYSKIWGWADEFGFKIDGDYAVMEDTDVDSFIEVLDKQYEFWKEKEKSKIGKT